MPDGIVGLITRALPIIGNIIEIAFFGYLLYQATQPPQTQQVSVQQPTTSINDVVQQFIPLVMLMMTIFLVFTMFKNIF